MSNLEQLYKYLATRFNDNYISIFGWSDMPDNNNIYEEILKLKNISFLEFKEKIKLINSDKRLAVGYCINPLNNKRRISDNVHKIFNIFIDLDGGLLNSDIDSMSFFLKKHSIKYLYSDKSGNGYHFIIPVIADVSKKECVSNFIKWVKSESKIDSVDTKVKLLTQICRFPETIHRKNEQPTKTEFIEFNDISDKDISENTLFIFSDKFLEKKYESNLINEGANTEDSFFSNLLSNPEYLDKLIKIKDTNKNLVLFKNLAIYYSRLTDNNVKKNILKFIKDSGHSFGEFNGWLEKFEKNQISKIHYFEIRKWIIDNELIFLTEIINEQIILHNNFLSRYIMCFLISGSNDNRFLLYNKISTLYSVSNEINFYKTILYEANQADFDFVKYYNIDVYKDDVLISITKIENLIVDRIKRDISDYKLRNIIQDFAYKPCNDIFFIDNSVKYFNIFRPGIFDSWYEKKQIYNFPNIKKLIFHLVGDGGEDGYNWFIKWLAHQIKFPTTKLPTSVIFKGTMGTGKGRLREWILTNLFGEQNIIQINESNLANIWGDYLINRRLVVVNEIRLYGYQTERVVKKIKEYSTDKDISIQLKGKSVKTIKNYTHWIFFSDQEMPFPIDARDRRHTVFNQCDKIDDEIVENLNPNSKKSKLFSEIKDFISYLKNLSVDFTYVSQPFGTKSKELIMQMSRDTVELFLNEILEFKTYSDFCRNSNLPNKSLDEKDTYILVKNFYETYRLWSIQNSYSLFKKPKSFTMDLSIKFGINCEQNSCVEGGRLKFYSLENIIMFIKKLKHSEVNVGIDF